jgi:hypothetical protein
MKKILNFAGLLALTICFSGCDRVNDSTQPIQIQLIEKSWTSSYEENTIDSINIYRPSDYKVFEPNSMFRQIFKFYDHDSCEYLVLAANYTHYMQTGIWNYDSNTKVVKIFDQESTVRYEFEIIELKHDLLKITPK